MKEQAVTCSELPDALAQFPALSQRWRDRALLLCLDYDGTLAPIRSRPDEALLPATTRTLLLQLIERIPVALISGRGLDDLRAMARLPGAYLAGNHGLEILGPPGSDLMLTKGDDFNREITAVAEKVRALLGEFPGTLFEDKRYSLSLHYRNMEPLLERPLRQRIEQLVAKHPELRLHGGKRVIEIRPNIDWHKGMAVHTLVDHLTKRSHSAGASGDWLPLFIGDDVTDEDAFRAVRDQGVGIVVCSDARATSAGYRLADTDAVTGFLQRLLSSLPPAPGRD